MSSRQVFLKHLGLPPGYLLRLGIVEADLDRVLGDVRLILRRGPVDDAAEERLQDLVERIRPPAIPVSLPATVSRPPPPGMSFAGRPATTFGSEPWWFTFEEDLEAEESRLPPRSLPLQRSGYVAGVRASLGLHNPKDAESDATMAGAIQFRILIQLATSIPSPASFSCRQPGIFSGGFPHLFVSNPRSRAGGRTVRLADKECPTHPSCECAEDGLPEGVVPAFVVMRDSPDPEIRGIYLVLARDLDRFYPPSCNAIRAKRAA